MNTTVLRDNAWARFNGRRPLVKITRASPTAGDRYELRDVDTDQVLKSPPGNPPPTRVQIRSRIRGRQP